MNASIVIIFITLLFSAFFSGMEIAFVSSNKLRFEIDKKQKGFPAIFLDIFYRKPQEFISTMLVGNNIALVVYGLEMAKLLKTPLLFISSNDLFITVSLTLISTLIVIFTGEFIPKTIFRINPNLWLNIFAIPLAIIHIILYPISKFSSVLSLLFLRMTGVKTDKNTEQKALSRVDLDYWIQESINNNPDDEEMENEVKIFQKALDFSSVRLRDCIVPRTEVVAVDETASLDVLKEKFIESGYSKIPVYRKDIDRIIGYIHSLELFKKPADWTHCINEIAIVPETMAANKLLSLFIQQKKNIAVVVDEFGGTAGIVTLEDIMEEIFGEIEDEHDCNDYVARQLGEHEFILSGRLEIDTVNRLFNLNFPETEDYVTIAGFILHHHQDFPKLNENISFKNYQIKILKVSNNKIDLINLKIIAKGV